MAQEFAESGKSQSLEELMVGRREVLDGNLGLEYLARLASIVRLQKQGVSDILLRAGFGKGFAS